MAEKEMKFIVVNFKHLEELDAIMDHDGPFRKGSRATNRLRSALDNFRDVYERKTGKKMDQEYIVCNQDEPYADDVWEIILSGEDRKSVSKAMQEGHEMRDSAE